MPEFDNEVMELEELNRKVDQRRKAMAAAARKKAAYRQRLTVRLMIYELICVLIACVSIALRMNGVITYPISVSILTTCVVLATFIVGWHAGYRRGADV